jgi:HK97 family phage major capsid protein
MLTNDGATYSMRKLARIVTTTTDSWKGVSSAGVVASFDAEASEVSDDSPTLAQPVVTTHMARCFVPYSIEIGMDYPEFASEMSRIINDAIDLVEEEKFWVGAGDGSNEPYGLVTTLDATSASEVVVTTDGQLGVVDVFKVWEQLPARHRNAPTAAWAADITTIDKIRRFSETFTGDGNYWADDYSLPSPHRLLGRPIEEASYFPDFTGTTGAGNILTVGDYRNYVIADRVGSTRVELVPHLFHTANNRPSGQRGWFAWKRVGGKCVMPEGFRLLQNQ